METYIIFAGYTYYPSGGRGDIKKVIQEKEKAIKIYNEIKNKKEGDMHAYDWTELVRIFNNGYQLIEKHEWA